ncbi:MAG: preprotein translocase subunit YajC [Butyrivibrio sp.]|nr:preprotein translocase subunit YajC [Butyrivibrio sp.]
MSNFGVLLTTTDAAAAGSGSSLMIIVIYVLIFAAFYFFMIRPQKKSERQKAQTIAALEVGDSVRTTGGFIGTVIDISEEAVIVEFGNNKNCRIPMVKEAIVEVEKPQDAVIKEEPANDKKKK